MPEDRWRTGRVLGLLGTILLLLGLGGGAWLLLSPPALLRVGTGYTAKVVCSNFFLAQRDAGEVLRVDVQAPGHPLLRVVSATVDEDSGLVQASFPAGIATAGAVARRGAGCAVAPDGAVDPILRPARSGTWGGHLNIEAAAQGRQAFDLPFASDVPGSVASRDPGLSALLDDPELVGPGMRAVLILHRGRVLGERYGQGFSAEVPLLGWSMTKAVTGALVGVRIQEGRLSLEQAALFPEWAGDDRSRITVADLMAMSSGLRFEESYGSVTDVTRMLYLEPDMATFAAGRPLEAEPGTLFSYSSGSSVLLSRILMDSFEDPVQALAWPREALFRPLGMASAVLEADARGTPVGSSYLYATPRDWARFGLFLLREGEWNGERLLPEGFVRWMRSPSEAAEGRYGRGHLWLQGPRAGDAPGAHPDQGFQLPEDAFWLLGHDGQSMGVVPSLELVVLRMGLTPSRLGYKPQRLLEAVVDHIASTDAGTPHPPDPFR